VSDQELTLALRALGRRLDADPVPDVAPAVVARIGAVAPRRHWRPLVLAIAVLLVAAAAAVAASDRVRDFLFGAGVDVQRVETLSVPTTPTATATTTPAATGAPRAPAGPAAFAPLGLGRPVDATAASEALGIDLPATDELGAPDAIFRANTADGPAITQAWNPADPVLLTIVPAHDESDPFIIGKELTEASSAEFVQLPGDGEGVFISGAPHAVTLFDGRTVRFRLAEDVLLWRPSGSDRVYRLEGRFDRARALALATSLR
jgi:hypothetical protein